LIVDDRPVREPRKAGERAYSVRVRDLMNHESETN